MRLKVYWELVVKLILDSNFLFLPLQFHIDIYDELPKLFNQEVDCIILSSTRQEILKIAREGSSKTQQQAILALKLAENCREIDVKRMFNETYDDVIVRVAADLNCTVATNDRELRRKLRGIGLPVVFLREYSRLQIDGEITRSWP